MVKYGVDTRNTNTFEERHLPTQCPLSQALTAANY